MNRAYVYEISVEGVLPESWSDWIEGLSIRRRAGELTTLRGVIVDQAALIGVLEKLHRFNLTIVSVGRGEL